MSEEKKLSIVTKSSEDTQAYIEAQQKVLTQLNKKIQKVENENIQLKIQLEKRSPIVSIENKNLGAFAISDEESIAREQLFLLRQVSKDRELSYEECKKVDTYTKILLSLKTKEIPMEKLQYDEMTPEELENSLKKDDNGTK